MRRTVRPTECGFTIAHEGFYPFKEKTNWPPECADDPAYFSPNFGISSKAEWEKFGYDEEESMEARSGGSLFYQPRPGPHEMVEPELRATGCMIPSKDLKTTESARCQMEGQCLTDSQQNRLQTEFRQETKSGMFGANNNSSSSKRKKQRKK